MCAARNSGYKSQLYENEIVIGDNNFEQHRHPIQNGERRLFGYVKPPEDYEGLGSSFSFPIIPRSEWDDRIKEMEQNQTRISDMLLQAGIPPLDQNGTNYCWANATVYTVIITRAQQNQEYVPLSPASVAAPIKNYSNSGGWGGQALDYMVQNGVASSLLWPANAISRQYFDSTRQNAALHKIQEYYTLDANASNIFDQIMTALFMRIPVSAGLAWWSHQICYCDPVSFGNGQYGVRFRNSWGSSYGSNGFNTLTEAKSIPDDACCCGVTIASNN